ncbi:MAG: type transport system permease protein [Candidatus Eremiobacteraeota bacterium]|jgi:ABC-type multidrug transport system permease subunit|nr:type transport system permease protein [Candidatus Eremiobacteraeota bacterium]
MAAAVKIAPASTLAKIAAIFRRDAVVALSYPGNFALGWLSIAVEVIIAWYISTLIQPDAKFGAGGEKASYFQFLAINFAFVRFQTAALNSFAEAIRDGQLTGTLEVVLATPTSLPVLVLSSGVWSFALTAMQTGVFILVAMLFGLNLSHLNPLTSIVFLVLTVAAVSPLGVLAAALAMVIKKTGPVEWASVSTANLFGGVFVPLASLPVALQLIGWCLPITHALNGFRAAAAGVPLDRVAGDAIWLAVATVVLTPLALWLFVRAVNKARVDGTLAMY